MIRDLRQTSQSYQRPNLKWQCGGDCHQCQLGPDTRGKCQSMVQCRPVEQDGNWVCCRSESLGGTCDCGPTETGTCGLAEYRCKPRRSLRWWRGRLTFAITAMTLGALVVLFNSKSRNEFLAPGALSSSHGQIIVGNDRCVQCHGAGSGSLFSWVTDAFSGGQTFHDSQSDLCMSCHKNTIDSELATHAHNLPFESLEELTEKAAARLGLVSSNNSDTKTPIACSHCHKEHQGNIDLKHVADQNCQSCHLESFAHFANDHPEFSLVSQSTEERTIKFDHVSHFGKHFEAAGKEFACSMCHESDLSGQTQLTKPYALSCAECHEQGIRQSMQPGWDFISLPIVDLQAINSANHSIGNWPAGSTGDFDGELPAILQLLICSDPDSAKALERLGKGFQFIDIDPDDAGQLDDAAIVLWQIKFLLFDLSLNGKEAVRARLEKLLHVRIDDVKLDQLMGGLDKNYFAAIVAKWFPNLNDEVIERYPKFKDQIETSYIPQSGDVMGRFIPGWRENDEHSLAENPLKELLKQDSNQSKAALDQNQPANQPNTELIHAQTQQDNAQPTGDLLFDNPLKNLNTNRPIQLQADQRPDNEAPPNKRIHNYHSDQHPIRQFDERQLDETQQRTRSFSGTGDPATLLAENPLKTLLVEDSTPQYQSPRINQGTRITNDSASNQNSAPNHSTANVEPQEQTTQANPTGSSEFLDALNSLSNPAISSRRWVRNDSTFSVKYNGFGHADRYFQAWTEIASLVNQNDELRQQQPLHSQLSSAIFVGNCASCHQTDSNNQLAWNPNYQRKADTALTKFSHRPHLTTVESNNCSQCHQLNLESMIDPPTGQVDFKPIGKSNCTSCHQPGGAESNCTTCHFYHAPISQKAR